VLGTSVTATNLSFSGAGTVTKTGTGTLQLAGTTANTQTSDFEVKRGVVELNKTAGTNAITGANLLIGFAGAQNETATVRLLASNQIANTTAVSLRSSNTGSVATLDLNDNADTIGSLTMGTTTGSGVLVRTGAGGTLTVAGNITLNSDRSGNDSGTNAGNVRITGTGAANTGTLNLGGGTRTITVQTTATGTGIGNADAIIDTAITNGGVVKEGSRALVLTGQNTYTDGTTINDGELQLRNASLSTGAVTVNEVGGSLSNAAILSGSGSIEGAVTIGEADCGVGILAVGSLTATTTLVPNYGTGANGTLTFNAAGTALTVASGSQIQMEITAATVAGDAGILDALSANTYVDAATYITNNSPAWTSGTPGNHDFINLTAGTLSLGSRSGGAGTGTVSVLNSGYVAGAQKGDVFNLIDWTGVMAGTFATTGFTQGGAIGDLDLPNLSGDLFWDTSAFATYGVIVVVPEPSRALLLLLGLFGLMIRRRRR
jgi:autotransporter-associated beta strand protein